MWSIADKLVELMVKNKVFGEFAKNFGMMVNEPQLKLRRKERNGSRDNSQEVL